MKRLIISISIVLVAVLAGCTPEDPAPTTPDVNQETPAPEPEPTKEEVLLTEIRDLLKEKR